MSRDNDGQHYDSGSGAPGIERGQRSKLEPGANVGQANGAAANMRVGKTSPDADISTTTGARNITGAGTFNDKDMDD